MIVKLIYSQQPHAFVIKYREAIPYIYWYIYRVLYYYSILTYGHQIASHLVRETSARRRITMAIFLLFSLVLLHCWLQQCATLRPILLHTTATRVNPIYSASSAEGGNSFSRGKKPDSYRRGGMSNNNHIQNNQRQMRAPPRDYEDMNRQVDRVLSACMHQGEGSSQLGITEVNHAIVMAGRLRRVDDAIKIFRSMSVIGLTADLMSYNNAIWCAGNAGRIDLSKSIFNELMATKNLKPNVYTYGSLMHACAKSKNHQLALKYLNQMMENGIVPNQVVFTSAMEACALSGNYKEALLVMDRMKRNNMRPDLTMVNAAIKACCLGGAIDDAEELAGTLRDFGAMDVFTYHTLMMGNTKLARHQRVLALYEEALQSNALLDGGIYSLAMLAALNCGLYQQVTTPFFATLSLFSIPFLFLLIIIPSHPHPTPTPPLRCLVSLIRREAKEFSSQRHHIRY